jgi:hypothetical protein
MSGIEFSDMDQIAVLTTIAMVFKDDHWKFQDHHTIMKSLSSELSLMF